MSRRKLTSEELELWRRVARTTERLDRSAPASKQKPLEAEHSFSRPRESIKAFEIGSDVSRYTPKHRTTVPFEDKPDRLPVTMDQKAFGRLRRGKLKPEAKIDLHGMTLAEAQPALTGFIMRSQAQGKRLVLVITGKGKTSIDEGPIPVRRGLLRHAVPQWLAAPPLAGSVLQTSEAHAKHGGGGAVYVYLRRNR